VSYRLKLMLWKLAAAATFASAEGWSWRWYVHVADAHLRWYQHLYWWPVVTLLNVAGAAIFMAAFLPEGRPKFYRASYSEELDAVMHDADPNDDEYWERRRRALSVKGVHGESEPIYKRRL
jgi:hypothetical protein